MKFRRIRFGDGKQWKFLYPQNKTLLYSDDIKGYWCKEHRKGMARIQAVISHYRHSHKGAKITDKIKFEEVIVEKSEKKLPAKLQKQKESDKRDAMFRNALRSNRPRPPQTPERKKLIDEIKMLGKKEREEKWWEENENKKLEEIELRIKKYETYKRAKDSEMPESELEMVRMKLGIPKDNTDDEVLEMLKKAYIINKLSE